MKSKVLITIVLVTYVATVNAQGVNSANEAYDRFKQDAFEQYMSFREKANENYATFMEQAWKEYGAGPALPIPKDWELKPEPIPMEDWNKPILTRPIKIEEIIQPVIPLPQPFPIEPIHVTPAPRPEEVLDSVQFCIYGTPMRVRFDDKLLLTISSPTAGMLAEAWRTLSGRDYNNAIADCIKLRSDYHLSDWAYLMMLDRMSEACMGKGDAATLFMAYIFCQTGYKMRLAIANNHVIMLYATEHVVYETPCYSINGTRFYPFKSNAPRMSICDLAFPKEQCLSLVINGEQSFAKDSSPKREIRSTHDDRKKVQVAVNKNLIAFYNDYPTSMYGENIVTRWAMYANVPLQKEVRESLYPQLREIAVGKTQLEAVDNLLSFCQWGFIYKYDDEVWGSDRAFFPEETLYYPYADCEDRSILFSRFVRDLFGLKVLLVYYPGHLATAVHFTEEVPGDYIMVNNQRFTICDPTYFGAHVGQTMEKMDNQTAKVILLE